MFSDPVFHESMPMMSRLTSGESRRGYRRAVQSQSVSQQSAKVVPAMQNDTISFLESCPNIWALLNQQAKQNLPVGLQEFLSGTSATEGRRQLRLANMRVSSLIARTSQKIVSDTYRRDLSGVDTESKLAELLCEMTLVDALASISDVLPILRPTTETGKKCDVKVVVEGSDIYGESKRLADRWKGGTRSIAKSPSRSRPPDADRPRAMDLFSKLKDVHTQFPLGTLNVLFLFHPSIWNTPVYIKQVLFGDAAGYNKQISLSVHGDGLYALIEWQKVSACAHSRVNYDGTLSIVQIWHNPRANIYLPDRLADRLLSLA